MSTERVIEENPVERLIDLNKILEESKFEDEMIRPKRNVILEEKN